MPKCPHCQVQVPDGSRFCGSCGGAQEARCPACDHTVKSGHKFCERCGSALNKSDSGITFSPSPESPSQYASTLPDNLPTPLAATNPPVQSPPPFNPPAIPPQTHAAPSSPQGSFTSQFGHSHQLSAPTRSATGWIVAGYILSLLGGLLGILIGLHLSFGKYISPEGHRIPKFSKTARINGMVIFIISLILFITYTNMANNS